MDHMTCDVCGNGLLIENDVRYEVKIEVRAAYDPLEITAEDLTKDFKAEVAKILSRLEGVSAEEAENQVYRVFGFDLCAGCQRRYLASLLRGEFVPA